MQHNAAFAAQYTEHLTRDVQSARIIPGEVLIGDGMHIPVPPHLAEGKMQESYHNGDNYPSQGSNYGRYDESTRAYRGENPYSADPQREGSGLGWRSVLLIAAIAAWAIAGYMVTQ